MEIKLTPQVSEEYFYNSLCNGLAYLSGYGLSVAFDKTKYKEAKELLQIRLSSSVAICYEDVLMQMLRNRDKIGVYDDESEEYTYITMEDVHERVQLTDARHLLDMINENDDAITADCILQTVFFKEIVFG